MRIKGEKKSKRNFDQTKSLDKERMVMIMLRQNEKASLVSPRELKQGCLNKKLLCRRGDFLYAAF